MSNFIELQRRRCCFPFYHVFTFTFQPLEEHFHFHVAGTTPDFDFRPFLIRIIFCRPFISSPQLRRWSQCLSRTTQIFVHNWIYLREKKLFQLVFYVQGQSSQIHKRETLETSDFIFDGNKHVSPPPHNTTNINYIKVFITDI